jgi:hypothetical protein
MSELPDTMMTAAIRNATIVAEVLSALPCSHIPTHTPESIPERVKLLVGEHARYYTALETIADGTAHAKAVAQRALGWPDNEHYHVELLREENLKLKLQLEALETKVCLELLDKGLGKNDAYGWDEGEAEEGHD